MVFVILKMSRRQAFTIAFRILSILCSHIPVIRLEIHFLLASLISGISKVRLTRSLTCGMIRTPGTCIICWPASCTWVVPIWSGLPSSWITHQMGLPSASAELVLLRATAVERLACAGLHLGEECI